jgi:hypothetical protein
MHPVHMCSYDPACLTKSIVAEFDRIERILDAARPGTQTTPYLVAGRGVGKCEAQRWQ